MWKVFLSMIVYTFSKVTYDLGSCYFFQQQMEKATEMFKQCKHLVKKVINIHVRYEFWVYGA